MYKRQIPFCVVTDWDHSDGKEPLGRRRGLRLVETIERMRTGKKPVALISELEALDDYGELGNRLDAFGVFTNRQTLEVDLFQDGFGSVMIETLREDYLQLARAKGMREEEVRRRHAVPNARLPVVSLSAINFGFIFSGAIAVETIFSWPGIGQATFLAVRGPDLPMLQGLFLLISATVIVANLIADLLYGKLDPRVLGR